MRTMSNEPKVLVEIEESYAIVLGFPTASTTLKKGQSVKLGTDGQVSAVAASTDLPLGIVSSAYQGNDKGNVRVYTPFVALLTNAISDGVTATGAELAATGVDANGLPKYKAAAAGDWVSGLAVKGGSVDASISVGVLRVPYKKA